ncbi:MAG: hypothetical protein O7J95_00985 [Planctomycetota bacterium]|nr:hypothetical protein [Planctomycetota bacterium]
MVVAMTVLVSLATLGLVVYVICGTRETWDLDAGAGRLARLKRRRERVLRTMKDLDTEREAGIITEEDFRGLRGDYKRQAVLLSKELERVRRNRLRQLSRGVSRATAQTRKRVESFVKARKAGLPGSLPGVLLLLGIIGAGVPSALVDAGVTLTGRLFDAEASFPAFRRELQSVSSENFEKAFRDEIKVPYAGRDVSIELVEVRGHSELSGGRVLGTWQTRTDADGGFVLDTQRETVPPGAAFVASAQDGGSKLFTPFFAASGTPRSLMLYRTSDRDDALLATVEVTYDHLKASDGSRLRVQIEVQLRYRDFTMYVGKSKNGSWREIFRVPLPEGATIVDNRGPGAVGPGWIQSADGRWLLINSPVAGIYDSMDGGSWRVTYDVPARQNLVQTFELPFGMQQREFRAWCVHEDMTIESPQLPGTQTLKHENAPVSSERLFDVHFSGNPLAAGSQVRVWLTVDNATIGQVSSKAVKWVGGFLLAFLVSILAGLVFGQGSPSPEVLFGDLSGEEVLDRIVDLDRRFEARKIREADYRRYREALVELAAEEIVGAEPASGEGRVAPEFDRSMALTAAVLPKEARKILRRLDELEEKSSSDPQVITERAHLLEALARTLPREAKNR